MEYDLKVVTISVESVEYFDTDDGTMVYIKDTNHQVYKQAFKEDESLIRISAGDVLHVKYQPMDNEIHLLQEFSFETK